LTGGYSNSSTGFVEANDLAFLILDKEVGTPLISRLASESEAAAATVLGKKMNFFGYGQTAKDSDVSMIPFDSFPNPVSILRWQDLSIWQICIRFWCLFWRQWWPSYFANRN
jgi:hypothetical protein